MTPTDRATLRALAEGAQRYIPGPWVVDAYGGDDRIPYVCTANGDHIHFERFSDCPGPLEWDESDEGAARFVAAVHPAAVLALLDRINALEQAARAVVVARKRLFDAGLAYYEAVATEPWNVMRRTGTETALGNAQLAIEQATDALAALVQEDADAEPLC